jgi:hypothetical protein
MYKHIKLISHSKRNNMLSLQCDKLRNTYKKPMTEKIASFFIKHITIILNCHYLKLIQVVILNYIHILHASSQKIQCVVHIIK